MPLPVTVTYNKVYVSVVTPGVSIDFLLFTTEDDIQMFIDIVGTMEKQHSPSYLRQFETDWPMDGCQGLSFNIPVILFILYISLFFVLLLLYCFLTYDVII